MVGAAHAMTRASWSADLGRSISTARVARMLSQRDLAAEVPCSASALSRWERGAEVPDSYSLAIVCEILGIEVPDVGREQQTRS
jgi:ribosome-binding protein aMBF1 (putative translation factor)